MSACDGWAALFHCHQQLQMTMDSNCCSTFCDCHLLHPLSRESCHIRNRYPVSPLETRGAKSMKRSLTIFLAGLAAAAVFGGLVYAALVVAHVSEPAATTV